MRTERESKYKSAKEKRKECHRKRTKDSIRMVHVCCRLKMFLYELMGKL